MDRPADIERRLRRDRGRRLWPEFRRALAVALDEEVTDDRLVPVEETELVRASYFDTLMHSPNVIHMIRGKTGLDELLTVAQRIGMRDPDLDAVLLHQHDKDVGAVRVRVAPVLRNAVRVWAVVGHDLFLTTDRATDGLCLEFNHEYSGDSYELHLWGRFAAHGS